MHRNLLFLLIVLPHIAFGWGATGHSAVCQIAYTELSDGARREVDRLIRLDPDYDSFAESCNWADGPPRQRPPDHYVNFPRSTSAVTVAGCPTADTCVLSAIDTEVAVMLDERATDRARLEALKLLGHWVGDIHQPMHTTFADDLGANLISAIVTDDDGEDTEATLHGVWDYWIIHWRLGDDYGALAQRLTSGLDDAQRDDWRFDSPIEWANESFRHAVSPEVRYCVQQSGACWYSPGNMILDRGEPQRAMRIGDDYATMHAPVIEKRLLQAGVRLGHLLNALLASD